MYMFVVYMFFRKCKILGRLYDFTSNAVGEIVGTINLNRLHMVNIKHCFQALLISICCTVTNLDYC